jgi:hypothetical protein
METPDLDWSGAAVRDSTLTVTITGERPKGWRKTFARTVRLLDGGGDWGDVECRRGKVRVESVPEGSEESLHHFLEAVLQQTNTVHELSGEGDGEADAETTENDDADGRMTERFRHFSAPA